MGLGCSAGCKADYEPCDVDDRPTMLSKETSPVDQESSPKVEELPEEPDPVAEAKWKNELQILDRVKALQVGIAGEYSEGDCGTIVEKVFDENSGQSRLRVRWDRTKESTDLPEQCCRGSSLDMVKLVIIGLPGKGKSTLLSGLFESAEVRYGYTCGTALTNELSYVFHKEKLDLVGIDVPGLGDPNASKSKAFLEMLRIALNRKGSYHLLFVLVPEAGRLSVSDVEMFKMILRAVPVKCNDFGIVVNKVSNGLKSFWDKDDNRQKFEQEIHKAIHPQTAHIHFQETFAGMDSAERNGEHAILPQKLIAFLQKLPKVRIDQDIDSLKNAHALEMEQEQAKLRESEEKYAEHLRNLALEHAKKEHEIEKTARERHNYIIFLTQCLAPLNAIALWKFVSYFSDASHFADNAGQKYVPVTALILAIIIPVCTLASGQVPDIVAKDLASKPMAEWLRKELALRALNVVVDFTNLYDICQEVAKGMDSIVKKDASKDTIGIMKPAIMYLLSLSIFVELLACNTGFHSTEVFDKWGKTFTVLHVLDAFQILCTLGIYFDGDDDAILATLVFGFMKAIFQIGQFIYEL